MGCKGSEVCDPWVVICDIHHKRDKKVKFKIDTKNVFQFHCSKNLGSVLVYDIT
jgi:hypothetical protein